MAHVTYADLYGSNRYNIKNPTSRHTHLYCSLSAGSQASKSRWSSTRRPACWVARSSASASDAAFNARLLDSHTFPTNTRLLSRSVFSTIEPVVSTRPRLSSLFSLLHVRRRPSTLVFRYPSSDHPSLRKNPISHSSTLPLHRFHCASLHLGSNTVLVHTSTHRFRTSSSARFDLHFVYPKFGLNDLLNPHLFTHNRVSILKFERSVASLRSGA